MASDQKFVTVICTTPWGERHEFRAEASQNGLHDLFVSLRVAGEAVVFRNGWSNYGPEYHRGFLYELAPTWRHELGLDTEEPSNG